MIFAKRKKSFQKRIFVLFLICAVVPLIITTIIDITLYTSRLSRDMVQRYDNVLSSLGNNIESYLEEMERLSVSPYLNESMLNLYAYINNNDLSIASSQKNNYIKEYENSVTRLITLTSPNTLGLAFFPLRENRGTGVVYDRQRTTAIEFSAEDYPLDEWFPQAPDAYKSVSYCAPHTVQYYTPGEDQTVFSVIKLIHIFDNGNNLGILKIDASTQMLDNLFEDISTSNNSFIFILSDQNELFYSTNEKLSRSFLENSEAERKNSGIVCTYTLEKSGWKLIYYISYWEFYKPMLEALLTSLLCGILVFLFSVCNYKRLSMQFTKPLSNILHTMHEAEQGNLSVKADASIPMNDEFRQITVQLNHMIQNLDDHIKKEYMAVISQKNAQYQALQAQINPHFLYNTLNNFIALNRIGERKLLEDSIIQLTRIFHYTCSSSGRSTIEEEFAFLEHYLFLQKIRFEERLDFSLNLDERARTFEIPRLLIQPLVENAIVHGMEDCDKPTKVEITASVITLKGIGECIFLAIFDNGSGFDKKKLNLQSSVGLLNITERLQLFEPESFFEIQSTVGEYTGSYIIIRKHAADPKRLSISDADAGSSVKI